MVNCEPREIRKEAAVSGPYHVPQLAWSALRQQPQACKKSAELRQLQSDGLVAYPHTLLRHRFLFPCSASFLASLVGFHGIK